MYRSFITSLIPLLPVALGLAVACPVVALLGEHDLVKLSLFSENLLASITLGAVTNYGIFLLGRYHEFRRQGIVTDGSLTLAYRSVAPVVVASALTVALALSSLSLARIDLLSSAGLPCAVGLVIGLVAALTLLPALIELAAKRGMAEPRTVALRRRWRRIGVIVARWPGPVLMTATSLLIILAIPIVATRISFNEAKAQPPSTESNRGYAAMDRHFPPNRALPELISIQADRDLRTPAGLIAIDRLTRKVLDVPSVDLVESGTRPAGVPLADGQITTQAGQIGSRLRDSADQITQRLSAADQALSSLSHISAALGQLQAGLARGSTSLGGFSGETADLADAVHQAQASLARVTQYLDPLRDYVQATPNCSTDTLCSRVENALEPVSVAITTTDRLAGGLDQIANGSRGAQNAAANASHSLDGIQDSLQQAQRSVTDLSTALNSFKPEIADLTDYLQDLSTSFRDSDEGGFYLPQRALNDPRFHRVAQLLFSKDGRATRLLVFGRGEVFGSDGAQLSEQSKTAAIQATKDGVLRGSTVTIAGVGSVVGDLKADVSHDFLVLTVVSLSLVLTIVTILLRSPVAGIAVVMTVAISYLSAIAMSALFWHRLFGHPLHWSVAPISFIALVAVGADYNLLLCSRFKEECPIGIRTGMIRAVQGTGAVVTSAGLVFALTMFALIRSNILTIAQIGTTVGIGLLIDTFIVRSFVVPALAGLLGRWFWWPFRLRDAKTGLPNPCPDQQPQAARTS
jgi:RND superfamily putative drug exporter